MLHALLLIPIKMSIYCFRTLVEMDCAIFNKCPFPPQIHFFREVLLGINMKLLETTFRIKKKREILYSKQNTCITMNGYKLVLNYSLVVN